MSISPECILLGDIGATNARFALLTNGVLGAVSSFEVAKFGRFADVVATFLKDHCREFRVKHAVLAIAGSVKGERTFLTNCSWVIDARELRAGFNLEARIVNDFEAVALAAMAYVNGFGGYRRRQTRSGSTEGCARTREWIGCGLPNMPLRQARSRFKRRRTCNIDSHVRT